MEAELSKRLEELKRAQKRVSDRVTELFPLGSYVEYRHGIGFARGHVADCAAPENLPMEIRVINERTLRSKYIHLQTHQPRLV